MVVLLLLSAAQDVGVVELRQGGNCLDHDKSSRDEGRACVCVYVRSRVCIHKTEHQAVDTDALNAPRRVSIAFPYCGRYSQSPRPKGKSTHE